MNFSGLDISTLILTNASLAFLFALIFGVYRKFSKTYYGFNHWFAGAILTALSLTISLSSSFIPIWAIVFLFHTIFMLAMIARLDGTIRFITGTKLHFAFYSIPLFLGLAVEYNYLYENSQSMRYLMHAITLVGITSATAWYLFRYAEESEKTLYYIAGVFMILRGVFKLFRALHWHFNPDLPLFNAETLHGVTMLAEILSEVAIALIFIMINGKRTEKHLKIEEEKAYASFQRAEQLANYDHLTGLPSLRLTRERLNHAIKQAFRNNSKVAIMFMDLNSFKPVNDQFGHGIGDLVLIEIGQRLSKSLRESDTIGRIGGDEFIFIFENTNDLNQIQNIGSKILDNVCKPMMFDDINVCVGASIGVAFYPDNGLNETDLLKAADQAMYSAKNSETAEIVFSEGFISSKQS
ncbi:MAG: GGDEF domain-containing protein [Gammaproteobacteria bacterium]|nr:GGDEF domain-containing protein [Gammaproteobacteria bacterium]